MTAVPLTTLALDTISADLVAGGTSVASGADAVIAAGSKPGKLIICFYFTTTGTVTFKAGANPPSQRYDMGNLAAISVASGTAKVIAIDAARYVDGTGKITASIGTNTAIVTAIQLPETV